MILLMTETKTFKKEFMPIKFQETKYFYLLLIKDLMVINGEPTKNIKI